METVQIRLHPLGKILTARKGSPLKDALHECGVEFPCGGKGTCGKCAVRILEGRSEPGPGHQKRLRELNFGPEWRLACKTNCDRDMVVEVGQFESIVQTDDTPFKFVSRPGLGIAVDLGTTTLVTQLVDLENGHILAVEMRLNPQKVFGSDLISRLDSALSSGPSRLTEMIRDSIGQMIGAMCVGRTSVVDRIVIVGNTVMQHFFCGADIKPLSFYPFESKELGQRSFTSSELGWEIGCKEIDFYPSIGSFVGSDILAGIAATGMHQKEEYSVLIDLGTNGEIVAGNSDRLVCASTAAGPAFEGARISRGMLATTGAIASVHSLGSEGCRVIGDAEPRGICGSGLIDAVGLMLQEDLIGGFGEILSGEDQIMIAPPVSLTQRDIQEFQLAKAAIAAGIEILIDQLGIKQEQVSSVLIAGAFGKYINVENVLRTGMLSFPERLVSQPGNTALMGARMFLFSESDLAGNILRITSHLNLESVADFQDIYVDHLSFIR